MFHFHPSSAEAYLRCTDPNVGFKLTTDESSFKCYMTDTGLLVSHAFPEWKNVQDVYKALQFGTVSINKGMFAENVIAQQLRASGHELFFYSWDEPSHALSNTKENQPSTRPREIDFLAVQGFSDAAGKLRLCPIEAKSSKTYSTISLDDFKKRWPKRVDEEVVLHPKQLKAEGHRTYLPPYISFCV